MQTSHSVRVYADDYYSRQSGSLRNIVISHRMLTHEQGRSVPLSPLRCPHLWLSMNNAAWKLQHLMGSYGSAQWVKVSAECSSLYYYIYSSIYFIYHFMHIMHICQVPEVHPCVRVCRGRPHSQSTRRWIKDKEYTLAHFVVCFLCHRHTKRSKKASSLPIIIGGSAALGRVSDPPNATRIAWRNLKFVFTFREYIYKVYLIIIDCRISIDKQSWRNCNLACANQFCM